MTDLRELMDRTVANPPAERHSVPDVVQAAGRDQSRRTRVVVAAAVTAVVAVAGLGVAVGLPGADRIQPAGPHDGRFTHPARAVEGQDYDVVARLDEGGYEPAGVSADGRAALISTSGRRSTYHVLGPGGLRREQDPGKSVAGFGGFAISERWMVWFVDDWLVARPRGGGRDVRLPRDWMNGPTLGRLQSESAAPYIRDVRVVGDRVYLGISQGRPTGSMNELDRMLLFSFDLTQPRVALGREVSGWVDSFDANEDGLVWVANDTAYRRTTRGRLSTVAVGRGCVADSVSQAHGRVAVTSLCTRVPVEVIVQGRDGEEVAVHANLGFRSNLTDSALVVPRRDGLRVYRFGADRWVRLPSGWRADLVLPRTGGDHLLVTDANDRVLVVRLRD